MARRNLRSQTRSTLKREWLGIWEVQDYYSRLEELAKDGAEITFGYALIASASALLATGGLLLNSAAVVIGSMCVAPFLGPSRAVCIGAVFRDRKTVLGGLVKQCLGLFIVGAGLACVTTVLLRSRVPGVEITPEILLRAMPAAPEAVLSVLIAVTAGAAASLALSADPSVVETPWGQIIDTMIGVEIAISLMPPASVVGIGLAFGRLDISRNALLLLMVNVLGLDIVGSALVLAFRGVRVQYLRLEKAIRQTAEWLLTTVSSVRFVGSEINVTLLNPTAARVHMAVRTEVGEQVPASLAQTIATEIEDRTGCRSEVAVDLMPYQSYSNL
jgi:uncharacterized hydrophobic protein (TIGR00341 family)